MINILIIITGSLLLTLGEMFMISAGLISLGMIMAVEVYNRVEAWKFILLFIILSVAIDAYFGYFLGTYYIAIVVGVLVHSILKRILPYDRLPIRIIVLFLTFLTFHLLRNYLVAIQISSLNTFDHLDLLLRSSIRSGIETMILIGLSYILDTYFGKSLTSVEVKV